MIEYIQIYMCVEYVYTDHLLAHQEYKIDSSGPPKPTSDFTHGGPDISILMTYRVQGPHQL